MRFTPLFAAVVLASSLTACVNHPPLVAKTSFIESVDVEVKPEVAPAALASMVSGSVKRESTRYGRAGEAKHLRIAITRLHYKNALQSLLIGDANNMAAKVAVVDKATGKAHGEFETSVIDSAALNGLSGAMISAFQDKAEVDRRLSQSLASDVLERVYGTEVAKVARERPVVEAETPAAAPAASPAAPKPAPKAAPAKPREPKTAMVEAPAAR